MEKIYILGSCRTAIGKFGGTLSGLSAVELGSIVIRESLIRAQIPAEEVDHVCLGCVLQAGAGQNIARQAAVKAGIPYSATAETLNCVCGSGLDAVNQAARLIWTGEADIVVACGTESMSNAPFALNKSRFGYRMGYPQCDSQLEDIMIRDGLWDALYNYHMGITAENVAEKYNISRKELDLFSYKSQRKASAATNSGAFRDEIVPVEIITKKGKIIFDRDEGIRPDTTLEALSGLKAAFKKDGIVTAGNSSGINDGAAAVVLISEAALERLNLKPEAEWMGGAMAGVDPAIMGIAPVFSTRKLLDKLDILLDDVDLIEANEAFASQSIAVARELGIPEEKLNINGGAIAMGHPIGASGCRILVTLIHEMINKNAGIGLATLCIGGGMGCSTLVRRTDV